MLLVEYSQVTVPLSPGCKAAIKLSSAEGQNTFSAAAHDTGSILRIVSLLVFLILMLNVIVSSNAYSFLLVVTVI